MQTIQRATKGLPVRVQVVDAAGAPVPLNGVPVFVFKGPRGITLELSGVIEDADEGWALYVLQPGDQVGELAGAWHYQVRLALSSGWSGHTEIEHFMVKHNLLP